MASPFLYFVDDRLSLAELSAACLDGDLVELGDAFIPADAVETRGLRAGSLTALLGDTLAASHLSAAWVHGALAAPPSRHTVQRAVTRRVHNLPLRHVVYRDLRVDQADLVRLGGVWVTSAVRTLVDLARVGDPPHTRAAALMSAVTPGLIEDAIARLDAGSLPYKHAALALLRGVGRGPAQEDVTRYTS
jgi:hypothetical protein